MSVEAAKAFPIRADDMKVIGYLCQRPIAVAVAAAFGGGAFRYEVRGYHLGLHGVIPDPTEVES